MNVYRRAMPPIPNNKKGGSNTAPENSLSPQDSNSTQQQQQQQENSSNSAAQQEQQSNESTPVSTPAVAAPVAQRKASLTSSSSQGVQLPAEQEQRKNIIQAMKHVSNATLHNIFSMSEVDVEQLPQQEKEHALLICKAIKSMPKDQLELLKSAMIREEKTRNQPLYISKTAAAEPSSDYSANGPNSNASGSASSNNSSSSNATTPSSSGATSNASNATTSTVPHFKFTASQLELIELMRNGEKLYLMPKEPSKSPTLKTFWVSEDLVLLCWGKEKKNTTPVNKRLPIILINSVIRGQETTIFLKHQKASQKQFLADNIAQSFSLVCEDKTMDLICKELMQTDTWIKGLQLLMEYVKILPKEIANPPKSRTSLFDVFSRNKDAIKPAAAANSSTTAAPAENSPVASSGGLAASMASDVGNNVKRQASKSIFHKFFKPKVADNENSNAAASKPPATPTPAAATPTTAVNNNSVNNNNNVQQSTPQQADPKPTPAPKPQESKLVQLLEKDKSSKKREHVVTAEDKQLFEFVVVASLKPDEKGNGMKPYISYSFPPGNVAKKENAQIMQSIPLFCFPDIELIKENDKIERYVYYIYHQRIWFLTHMCFTAKRIHLF